MARGWDDSKLVGIGGELEKDAGDRGKGRLGMWLGEKMQYGVQ